jgi:hypothetical protein
MDAAPYHTAAGKRLLGAMGDSAPDRWGRALMMRAEARRERKAGEPQRTLWESDYLLLGDDETRQGALRFAEKEDGPFLHQVVDHRRFSPMSAFSVEARACGAADVLEQNPDPAGSEPKLIYIQ